MKKMGLAVLFVLFVSTLGYAETTKQAVGQAGGFWQKEGERSGLAESTSSWGKFWENMNPGKFFQDQQNAYNARKGGVAK